MASITQDMKYRLSLIKYAKRFGVTKAAIKYHHNRQYIYRWLRRYDGSIESLRERSRRPHSHKRQHTSLELKLISDMGRRNPHAGLVVFWIKLRQKGYSRSITGLYRVLIRQSLMPKKLRILNIFLSLMNRCSILVRRFINILPLMNSLDFIM